MAKIDTFTADLSPGGIPQGRPMNTDGGFGAAIQLGHAAMGLGHDLMDIYSLDDERETQVKIATAQANAAARLHQASLTPGDPDVLFGKVREQLGKDMDDIELGAKTARGMHAARLATPRLFENYNQSEQMYRSVRFGDEIKNQTNTFLTSNNQTLAVAPIAITDVMERNRAFAQTFTGRVPPGMIEATIEHLNGEAALQSIRVLARQQPEVALAILGTKREQDGKGGFTGGLIPADDRDFPPEMAQMAGAIRSGLNPMQRDHAISEAMTAIHAREEQANRTSAAEARLQKLAQDSMLKQGWQKFVQTGDFPQPDEIMNMTYDAGNGRTIPIDGEMLQHMLQMEKDTRENKVQADVGTRIRWAANSRALEARIYLPDNDPAKIADPKVISAFAANHDLDPKEAGRLIGLLGRNDNDDEKSLALALSRVHGALSHINPVSGLLEADPKSEIPFGEFEQNMRAKLRRLKAEGKDASVMWTPGNPDSIFEDRGLQALIASHSLLNAAKGANSVKKAAGVATDTAAPHAEGEALPPLPKEKSGGEQLPNALGIPRESGKPGDASVLPHPKTQKEYDALPPNTTYVDTDGKVKRKR